MRLEQLQHIIEVYNKKSISEAARTLLMSQPQLSHSIKQLENELGYKIFRRNNMTLIPTSQGIEVLVLAQELINYVEQVKTYTKGTSVIQGNVSLSLGPAVFNAFASPLMVDVHQNYPNVNLTITEDYAQDVIRRIEDGSSMLGVTGWPKSQDLTQLKLLDSKNIAYKKLLDTTFKLLIGSNHPLAHKSRIRLSDLQNCTFVDYCGINEAFIRMSGITPKVNQSIFVYDREMLKSILSDSKGVAIFPAVFALHDIYFKEGLLQLLPIYDDIQDNIDASLYLIYLRNEPLPYILEHFIYVITDVIQGIAPHLEL